MAELAGKHALVTGGGTGIGMGIARQLLKAGATVTISGRREDVQRAQRACSEIRTSMITRE